MSKDVSFFITVFMSYFAIVNPIAITPIFMALTETYDENLKKKTAIKSVISALIIGLAFIFFGHVIFNIFGISMGAFKIAGGFIVAKIGYDLLQGKSSDIAAKNEKDDGSPKSDIAITPIAIPLLAGPGAIAASMNFTGDAPTFAHVMGVIIAFVAILLITLFMFLFADKVSKSISPSIMNVLSKLMGLILAILGVQMLCDGIKAMFMS